MNVYSGSEELGDAAKGCVLTLGNFDGLHLGHRALLRAVTERAEERKRLAAVYTFSPHPRRVLNPERFQPQLMTQEQVALGMEAAGIDLLIWEPFTKEFAAQTSEVFLREIIAPRVNPSEILVGRDFHFGRGRGGSGQTLADAGPQIGVHVEIIQQVRAEGDDVSSTRIRNLLVEGRVEEAATCLGAPYAIWGSVVPGERRGRTLGFPTANLASENELIPGSGVYATYVRLFEGDRPGGPALAAVTNVGTRPTFSPGEVLAEAHLLDYQGDLYGQRIEIRFEARLRDERRFSGPDELAKQIARDAADARERLLSQS